MELRPSQTAVVTGAGSGIGRALARALAQRGCQLALVDIRAERLALLERELAPRASALSVHALDVSSADAVRELAARVQERHGRASLLVNSAGVSHSGAFSASSAEDFDWVMRVNFGGTVHTCRAFLPQFQAGGVGHIVNVSSCFGLLGFPTKAAYSASKFAVRGFSEALRAELSGTGIGVTIVYPGPVDTNIARDGRSTDATVKEREIQFLARRALPAERVAEAVLCGVQRDAARVLLGRDYRAIDLLVRLAPTWAQSLNARFKDGPR